MVTYPPPHSCCTSNSLMYSTCAGGLSGSQ
nr:MAG TPA: hypothetical protein [Bacteriophage sp.]